MPRSSALITCPQAGCLFNHLFDRRILDREIADRAFLQQAVYDPCSICLGYTQFHLPLFCGDDLSIGSETRISFRCLHGNRFGGGEALRQFAQVPIEKDLPTLNDDDAAAQRFHVGHVVAGK
jgi:hypothetical protein